MTKKTRAKARRALLTLSLVLVVAFAAVGGTIAWLTDSTDVVKNTFSPTTINIELKEHEYDPETGDVTETETDKNENYELVPGLEMEKDPFVRVKANSEPCYVFVKVTESTNLDTFVDYSINAVAWTQVPDTTDVYYYGTAGTLTKVPTSATDTVLSSIITNDAVKVKDVSKAQLDALNAEGAVKPSVEFVAYAVQAENLTETEIAAIWALAQGN